MAVEDEEIFPRTSFVGKDVVYAPDNPPKVGHYTTIVGKPNFGKDVTVGHGVRIEGEWNIRDGVVIGHGCQLEGKGTIGGETKIRYASKFLGEINIGPGTKVYHSILANKVNVGDLSEIINSNLGIYVIGTQNIQIGKLNKIVKSSLYGVLRMGDKNEINDATLGSHPQLHEEKSEDSYLIIGNENKIREYSSIQGSPTKERATRIGNECHIMAQTHIAHDDVLEDRVIIVTGSQIAGHVYIEEYAIISGQNGIEQFVRIGANTQTAGRIAIRRDILSFFRGNPEKNWAPNLEGLKRAGVKEKQRTEIKEVYRNIIFNPQVDRADIPKKLLEYSRTLSDPQYIDHLREFILRSEKGKKPYIISKEKENEQRKLESHVSDLERLMGELKGEIEQLKQGKKRKSLLRKIFFFLPPYRGD